MLERASPVRLRRVRKLLMVARRLAGRYYRLGLRRVVFRADLAGAVDSPRATSGDLRWIRAHARSDDVLAEAALLQLVRRGAVNVHEQQLIRQRAAGSTSGIVGWRRGYPIAPIEEGLAALAATEQGSRPAVAWPYWPVDNHNPYQTLIYSRFPERGLVPIRLPRLSLLDRLRSDLPPETPIVLHVHWLYRVTAHSVSRSDAAERVARFSGRISDLKAAGVRLVWTIHNTLPHETAHPDVELELRRFMMENADVVHLMSADQEGALSETFGAAPKQVVIAPHPSYVGAYPDWIDRTAARTYLGIPDDLRVLATVGQIRPYKGYPEFLRALAQVHHRDPHIRWLVAGTVREEGGWRELLGSVATHPAVLCFPGFVPPEDVQLFLRAADAAVFPYLRSLNSGAVALAASFGLPAYVSSGTQLGGLLPEGGFRRFDLSDPDALQQALGAGASMETPEVRAAVRAHADGLRPGRVSGELADALVKTIEL